MGDHQEMEGEIIGASSSTLSAAQQQKVHALVEKARRFQAESKAENTKRAYRADWQDFLVWCEHHGQVPLPAAAETVVLYLTDLAEHCKLATLERRLVVISRTHKAARFDSPTTSLIVEETMKGIRRSLRTAQTRKAPIGTKVLKRMLATIPPTTAGLRDRTLLLVGFAGALRRSELVGLNWDDLQFSADGVTLAIRQSKTDQEGEGQTVAIPYGSRPETCPVQTLLRWREASGFRTGAVFRRMRKGDTVGEPRLTDDSVARIIKRIAEAAGLTAEHYAGHSLRAGMATQAAAAGAEERDIMRQTRHRSVIVARRYIREGSQWTNNAAGKLDL